MLRHGRVNAADATRLWNHCDVLSSDVREAWACASQRVLEKSVVWIRSHLLDLTQLMCRGRRDLWGPLHAQCCTLS